MNHGQAPRGEATAGKQAALAVNSRKQLLYDIFFCRRGEQRMAVSLHRSHPGEPVPMVEADPHPGIGAAGDCTLDLDQGLFLDLFVGNGRYK